MWRKGGREKKKTIKDKKSAVIRQKKSRFVLSLRSVYFADYTASLNPDSRDTESDSTQKLLRQLPACVTGTSRLREF